MKIVFPKNIEIPEIPKNCEIIVTEFHIKENNSTWEPDSEDLIGLYTWDGTFEQIKLLNSLNYKGFNNWRLPTKEELNFLYENKDSIGGFSSSLYWSSTEVNNYNVWSQDFGNSNQYSNDKNDISRVRCVRDIES